VRGLVTVLGNLIDNALDSVVAENGSNPQVDVAIVADGDSLVLRVHDSGPGIDPRLIDEIFRDGFTTKIARGAMRRGLGLALVSQEVRRRGGTISVENADGALFVVTIPLSPVRGVELERAAS
jgi:two-component system CitB family sensor kinase